MMSSGWRTGSCIPFSHLLRWSSSPFLSGAYLGHLSIHLFATCALHFCLEIVIPAYLYLKLLRLADKRVIGSDLGHFFETNQKWLLLVFINNIQVLFYIYLCKFLTAVYNFLQLLTVAYNCLYLLLTAAYSLQLHLTVIQNRADIG